MHTSRTGPKLQNTSLNYIFLYLTVLASWFLLAIFAGADIWAHPIKYWGPWLCPADDIPCRQRAGVSLCICHWSGRRIGATLSGCVSRGERLCDKLSLPFWDSTAHVTVKRNTVDHTFMHDIYYFLSSKVPRVCLQHQARWNAQCFECLLMLGSILFLDCIRYVVHLMTLCVQGVAIKWLLCFFHQDIKQFCVETATCCQKQSLWDEHPSLIQWDFHWQDRLNNICWLEVDIHITHWF